MDLEDVDVGAGQARVFVTPEIHTEKDWTHVVRQTDTQGEETKKKCCVPEEVNVRRVCYTHDECTRVNLDSIDPWMHYSLEPWTHYSLEPWTHYSLEPWTHYSLEPWTHYSLDPLDALLT